MTEKLTREELVRSIEEKEKEFQAADGPKKRVMIAQDVIESLKANKIEASGCWADFHEFDVSGFFEETDEDGHEKLDRKDIELRDALVDQDLPECSACALGALFVCSVIRTDNFTVTSDTAEGMFDYEEMASKLEENFSPEQIRLIEIAYEMGTGGFLALTYEEIKARGFWDKYIERQYPDIDEVETSILLSDRSQRMTAVMQNIIDNKGTFIP